MSVRSIWLQLPILYALCGLSPAWALSCAEITTKLQQLTQALDGTHTDPVKMMVQALESSNSDV